VAKPEPYRILITGSRDWKDKAVIRHAIFSTWQKAGSPKNTVVIVGRAHGADTIAETCSEAFGFTIEPYEADWRKEGRAAGQNVIREWWTLVLIFVWHFLMMDLKALLIV